MQSPKSPYTHLVGQASNLADHSAFGHPTQNRTQTTTPAKTDDPTRR